MVSDVKLCEPIDSFPFFCMQERYPVQEYLCV